MKKVLTVALLTALIGRVCAQEPILNGMEMQVDDGLLRVEFVKSDIVRVRYTLEKEVAEPDNDICLKREPGKVKVKRTDEQGYVILRSDSLTLRIDRQTGCIAYYETAGGELLLQEDEAAPHRGERIYVENVTYDESTRRTVKTADGDKEVTDVLKRDTVGSSWKWRLALTFKEKEALYGLGGHMEDYMNLRGKRMYLCQHNLKEVVPVLNSTAGYGLLMNAGSEMVFDDGDTGGCLEVGAAPQLDYYFMKGRSMDATVRNYRWLTGDVPLMPLYLFGYTQSKERYVSSNDLISTLKQFRDNHIPIDMIEEPFQSHP